MSRSRGVSVAEVVLAKDVFDAGDAGYGLMLAAMGLGLVARGPLGGGWVDQRGVAAPTSAAIGADGARRSARGACAERLGRGGAARGRRSRERGALVCNAVLVQRGVPDQLRGRAFTLAMSVSYAALGLGHGRGRAADRRGRRAPGVGDRRRAARPSPCVACARAHAGRPGAAEAVAGEQPSRS